MRATNEAGRPSLTPGGRQWTVRQWLVLALACGIGTLLGLGGFVFRYAEGLSYFGTEPEACVNCHIMRPQYDGWQKGSHHAVAVCIDCHLPHDFVPKYVAKTENGYRHGKEFTLQTFAEPITVKARGREILEENCVRCHQALVAELSPTAADQKKSISCVRCHATVGHGDTARWGGRLTVGELEVGHE
ncbi:MAG TPA: cytochrome c nitrite reductase small subunit [Polyangiaceae bacterium]